MDNKIIKKNVQLREEEYHKEYKQLLERKADLGYLNLSVEEFLQIVPDSMQDLKNKFAITALQLEFYDLQEHEYRLFPERAIVAEFNKKHAVIHIDQTYILTEKKNAQGHPDFSLESRQSFLNFYEEETVLCSDEKVREKAKIWLKSKDRRKYLGITFDPKNVGHKNSYYNIWRGFAIKPKDGITNKYWGHVFSIICSGDNNLYLYVRKWLAYIVQHPDEVHTALVLCGSQGVGKNTFVEPIGKIFGQHYILLSSMSELVSNFNSHLKNAVLIHANEALWGGNKKDLGAIKAMITEQTCLIEGKGKDRIMVKNYKHIILSSNEDWPVHLDSDDRRFLVLRVSDKRKEDHKYFKAIQEELEGGGYEALLHDLLGEELQGFNPRLIPHSTEAFPIKLRSADSTYRYLYEALLTGSFSVGGESKMVNWELIIAKALVYKDYTLWCEINGENRLSQEIFGKTINRLIPSVRATRSSFQEKRYWSYQFSQLQDAREEFCKSFKEKVENIFSD